jgi:pyrrolidone-carboxylate peptidase
MRLPVTYAKQRELVEKALQQQAPRLYLRLKRDDALEAFLKERVGLMNETFETLADQAGEKAARSPLPYLQGVQQHNQELSAAAEAAIAQAVEFEPE